MDVALRPSVDDVEDVPLALLRGRYENVGMSRIQDHVIYFRVLINL